MIKAKVLEVTFFFKEYRRLSPDNLHDFNASNIYLEDDSESEGYQQDSGTEDEAQDYGGDEDR
jgi:hypothetical protein